MSAPARADDSQLLYTLERTTTLPSSSTDWDYVKMQPGSSRFFMARLNDGLTVFDVDANKVVATVANSIGANGPLLLPQYDRGYIAMADGSILSVDLSTLAPISRTPLANDGGLNSAVYDPATRQVHAIVSSRPERSTWFTLDAASGRLVKRTEFPFRKMDDPAPAGDGVLYAPARRDKLILKLDSRTLAEQARWSVDCNVSKVRYQQSTKRLLAACSGDDPLFLALDAQTGRTVARIPIGRGMDALVLDEQRKRIVTADGVDGVLSVIAQKSPDEYELLGTVTTRVGARMMHIDERTGRLLVVTADSTVRASGAGGATTEIIHPNTFTVLTYKPL
jgi:hypothetical protein